MLVDQRIIEFVKGLRKEYPRLGKDKIKVLLADFCQAESLVCPSASTIGKLINRNGWFFYLGKRSKRGLRIEKKRLFGMEVKEPGDLVQVDTVVRFDQGVKRYIVTAIDVHSRFAFAYTYKSHSSRAAADFFAKLEQVSPVEIKAVQTDNGSEFLAEFDQALKASGVVHLFTYPNCPKQNAAIERFNRTIQEECADHYCHLLPELGKFNDRLIDYLLFYNTKRPHQALKYRVPLDCVIAFLGSEKSNMYATSTLI